MDIEEKQGKEKNEEISIEQPALRYSKTEKQSRFSNQSLMSLQDQMGHGYPQEKISLQSNISEKVRHQQNQKGLFEQLISNEPEQYYPKRIFFNSNPSDFMDQRMSQECNNTQEKADNGLFIQQKLSFKEFVHEPKTSCRCSRSKCLLMYCECFSRGLTCNSSCSCYQCRNNDEFQEIREKARHVVLDKDPNAFTNQLEMIGSSHIELGYKKGCNCKRTKCFKKYCECFQANVKCTYLCKCQGCLNGGQNAYEQQK